MGKNKNPAVNITLPNEIVTAGSTYSALRKFVYVILGALLTGAMWRARGTHGWGSSWGVYTVGMLLLVYIYFVFKRKTNATFFHIVATSILCMLTTPAWGTLLNQTSGYFEAHATEETYECNPLSGVFIMFCLGFGTMTLYGFGVSRLFSDKRYSIVKYIAVGVVFFGVFYLCCATVSHWIIGLIQPESAEAFAQGLKDAGKDADVYSFYMKHFTSINSAKKIPYGRNYFTEISVVSRAIASLVTALFVRFGFKDRAGGGITFTVSTAFGVGITLANVFFVLKNNADLAAHEWLKSAWSFWEFFTGFIAGGTVIAALFVFDKKHPDAGFRDVLIPKLPPVVTDTVTCVVVMGMGFGLSLLRPLAVRLDESDVFPIIVYAVGGVAVVAVCALMFTGKLPKLWRTNAVKLSPKLTPVLFAWHMFCYLFVGYTEECLPNILVHEAIQYLMYAAVAIFFVAYAVFNRKHLFKKKR